MRRKATSGDAIFPAGATPRYGAPAGRFCLPRTRDRPPGTRPARLIEARIPLIVFGAAAFGGASAVKAMHRKLCRDVPETGSKPRDFASGD